MKTVEKTVDNIRVERMHEKINLRNRELLPVPWELEELKALNGKALRPSLIDSIERHAWKTDGVYRVVRIRKTEQREVIEELWILFDDESEILAHSTESTYVIELAEYL